MKAANNPPWRPITIGFVSWIAGLALWFGVLTLDAIQYSIRTVSLGRGDHQRPKVFGSMLDSDIAIAVIYGACSFLGAFLVGRKHKNGDAALYVFAIHAVAALLWFLTSLSYEIKTVELLTVLFPVLLAPGAMLLAIKIFKNEPSL
jgi:lipopolysaccharide export LptBFGC system permease protein LptF